MEPPPGVDGSVRQELKSSQSSSESRGLSQRMLESGSKTDNIADTHLLITSNSSLSVSSRSSPRPFVGRSLYSAGPPPRRETNRQALLVPGEDVSTVDKFINAISKKPEKERTPRNHHFIGEWDPQHVKREGSISDNGFLSVLKISDEKDIKEKNKIEEVEHVRPTVPPLKRMESSPVLIEEKGSPKVLIRKILSLGGNREREKKGGLKAVEADAKGSIDSLRSNDNFVRGEQEKKLVSDVKVKLHQCINGYYTNKGVYLRDKKYDRRTCLDILRTKEDVNQQIGKIISEYIWVLFEGTLKTSELPEIRSEMLEELHKKIISSKGVLKPIVELLIQLETKLRLATQNRSSMWIEKLHLCLNSMISDNDGNFINNFLSALEDALKDDQMKEIFLKVLLCNDKKEWGDVKAELQRWNNPSLKNILIKEMKELITVIFEKIYKHFNWFNSNLNHLIKPKERFKWNEEPLLRRYRHISPICEIPLANIYHLIPTESYGKVPFRDIHLISKNLERDQYTVTVDRVNTKIIYGEPEVRRATFFNILLTKIYAGGFDPRVTSHDIDKMIKLILTFGESDDNLEMCFNHFLSRWSRLFVNTEVKSGETHTDKVLHLLKNLEKELIHSKNIEPLSPQESLYVLLMAKTLKDASSINDAEITLDLLIKRFEVYSKAHKLTLLENLFHKMIAELSKTWKEDELKLKLAEICDKLDSQNLTFDSEKVSKLQEKDPALFTFINFYLTHLNSRELKESSKLISLRIFLYIFPDKYENLFQEFLEEINMLAPKNNIERNNTINAFLLMCIEARKKGRYPALFELQCKLPGLILHLMQNNFKNLTNKKIGIFGYRLSLCQSLEEELSFVQKFDRMVNLLKEATLSATALPTKHIIQNGYEDLYKPPINAQFEPSVFLRITLYPNGTRRNNLILDGSSHSTTDSTASSISPRSEISKSDLPLFMGVSRLTYKISQRIVLVVYPLLNPHSVEKPNIPVEESPLFSIPCDFKLWRLEGTPMHEGRFSFRKALYNDFRRMESTLIPVEISPIRWHVSCITFGYRTENEKGAVEHNIPSWSTYIYRILESPLNPLVNMSASQVLLNPPQGALARDYQEMTAVISARGEKDKR